MTTTQFYIVFHMNEQEWTELSPSLIYMYEWPSIQLEQPEYSKNTVRMIRIQNVNCATNTITTHFQYA